MSLNAFAKSVISSMGKANPDIVLDPNKQVEFIPTGCLSFNLVAGGGLPRGRLTEVFGMEHSGKTALALSTHHEVGKAGGTSIHIDAEFAFDENHARQTYRLVQNDNFKVFQPACAEEAGQLLDLIIASGIKIDFISIDSVDALKPKDLIEGALDKEARVGAQAKKVGQIVNKCRLYAMKTNTAILFLNQMRVNINTSKYEQNVGTGSGYNPMESHTVPGGYALRFYASLRMKLEYGGKIEIEAGENAISGEAEKQRTGQKVKIINIKNKVVVDDKRKAEEALDRGEAAPALSVMDSLNLDERSAIEDVEIQTTEQYKTEAEEILPSDMTIPNQQSGSVTGLGGQNKNPFAETKSTMGLYNETNGQFKALSATEFSDHDTEGFSFLIEVPAATCPEFVLEYLKNPFIKRIDPSEITHHPLDKSKFSSVLKISTSMTMSLWGNLKASMEARQVIKDFRVDFFISPEAYLVEPVADDSLLHILVTFNVSAE
ncbi:unnamed protein product [Notodromas monacha]|uniref:Uncharacterized protein n=1 Tax=Notodromas monacha TaxID=399045 RepID=A0A7R9C1F6_9CRUS|nr:unnamed protein product [Notodromas monacha]CAG0925134.1 unnamed protein product [Notodromas monacha]